MDPEQTLKELRALVRRVLARPDDPSLTDIVDSSDDAADLAEKFDALDEWLTKGGFPPTDWRHGVPARG